MKAEEKPEIAVPSVEEEDLEDEVKSVIEKTAKYVSQHGEALLEVMKKKNEGNGKFQ